MTDGLQETPTVFIVDDDPAIRFGMEVLMQSVGLNFEIFHSADAFLEHYSKDK